MSEEHKKAVKEFVASTGDESYITGNKQVLGGRDGDPVTLPGLADAINEGYEKGEMMRKQTCAQFIEVGRLLNIARKAFTSNPKFGKWRKDKIGFSQSHVQRLMSVATEFGDNPDAALVSFGTLAVLLTAPDEMKDKVIEDAKEGKTTKRAEVIEAKKDAKAPDSVEDAQAGMEEAATPLTEVVEPEQEEWETAQVVLDMKFAARLALLKIDGARSPFHNACLLFGIPPFHDGRPSNDLVSNLYFSLTERLNPDQTEDHDKLTAAHDILMATINLADD